MHEEETARRSPANADERDDLYERHSLEVIAHAYYCRWILLGPALRNSEDCSCLLMARHWLKVCLLTEDTDAACEQQVLRPVNHSMRRTWKMYYDAMPLLRLLDFQVNAVAAEAAVHGWCYSCL